MGKKQDKTNKRNNKISHVHRESVYEKIVLLNKWNK